VKLKSPRTVLVEVSILLAGTVYGQSSGTGVGELLERAQEAQAGKNYPRAAEEYREALKLKPSAEIYEKLGLVYFLQNSFDLAVGAFSEALRPQPDRWASQLFLGISLYRTNRFKEALPHLQQALKLNSQQNDARYWLGATYKALGEYPRGIDQLRLALENDPKNIDTLYALAEAYLDFSTVLSKRLDRHPEEKRYRETLEERAGIRKLIQEHGEESLDQLAGEWRQVEGQYKQVLKSHQADEDGLYILSRVYAELAQLTAERLWELEPNSVRAHQVLGEAYEGKEDYEKALQEYQEALRLNPQAPGLHYSVGHAYWQMKRFEAAIPELEKELALNPHHASANYVLGHIYLYQRKVLEAAHYLEAAVNAKPDFVEARKQWAKALSLLQDNQKAIRQLEIAAAADPQDDSIHYLLARIYRKIGRQDKAQKELGIFDELRRRKHHHEEPQEESDPPT
jgi:tetratricopeptide (TPR) repeat protein